MTINVVPVPDYVPVVALQHNTPGVNEFITGVNWNTLLEVILGATATTVTVVRPGNHLAGDPVGDFVWFNAATNVRGVMRLFPFSDTPGVPGGTVNVLFSQLTNVTARLMQF